MPKTGFGLKAVGMTILRHYFVFSLPAFVKESLCAPYPGGIGLAKVCRVIHSVCFEVKAS